MKVIITQFNRGNALLVGVGGSGKQSLTKLASFIAGYKFYQITLTRSYNINNLVEDLKYLYRVAGLEGQGISFIFTDNDIKDEGFLEYMNNILSSGEIANLFPKDEMDEIINELIPRMKKVDPKRPATIDNLHDFFITRARTNIHVVLCFSPVGEKFRNRALKFPGLISGCTIDWFQKWPKDALIAVSNHFIENFELVCNDEAKSQTIVMMASVQETVSNTCTEYFERFRRQAHVTPKSFLSFLDSYKKLYKEKQNYINMLAERMKTGLVKLDEASAAVDILKQELEVKNEEIAVVAKKAAEISADASAIADEAKKIEDKLAEQKHKIDELVEQINVEKVVAEEKLQAALPALQKAAEALDVSFYLKLLIRTQLNSRQLFF